MLNNNHNNKDSIWINEHSTIIALRILLSSVLA